MNKQSNVYTTLYIIVLVVLVGTALAATSLALRDRQQANENADKMRQILASVHVTAQGDDVIATYNKCIVSTMVIDSQGKEIKGEDAFGINVAEQVKLPASDRKLPVFVCKLPADGSTKYILPAYGAGLWGPIWGYISVDADGSTIYGAYFAHQGETPGLGAEIEKPAFCNEFDGKHLEVDGKFMPVAVVKAGQHPADAREYVNGISGGTITSKGVSDMLDNCLAPYQAFLSSLK